MGQVAFILGQPWEYTKILTKFLWDYWSPRMATVYIGTMAYLGDVNNAIVVFWFSFITALVDKASCDVWASKVKNRLLTFVFGFSASVFVATALYVAFTPVASETILGCQSRYLLPILFPVMFFLGDFRFAGVLDKCRLRRIIPGIVILFYTSYAVFALYNQCLSYYK